MKKVNLGLIGLGSIGKVHLRDCLDCRNARVVAVSDVSKRTLRLARKMGVKNTFTDYQELLRTPNLDAVIVSLPTYLHADCAQAAAEARKDIFLEKPLARNTDEGKRIVTVVRRNGVKLMIGYDMRYDPPFVALKRKILDGVLGEVLIAYGTLIGSGPFSERAESGVPSPTPSWWFDSRLTGGGALIDLGCHLINLFRWYFGEICDIKSHFGHRFNMDSEDNAICFARFEAGQLATINVGWFSQENQAKVELYGTAKHAIACHSHQSPIRTAIDLMTRSSRIRKGYFEEIRHFVHCVEQDLRPITSGEDALKDLEAISEAYKSGIFSEHF